MENYSELFYKNRDELSNILPSMKEHIKLAENQEETFKNLLDDLDEKMEKENKVNNTLTNAAIVMSLALNVSIGFVLSRRKKKKSRWWD